MTPATIGFCALAVPFVACSGMALRAQADQAPSLEAWNLAAAGICTALALFCALTGAWTYAAVVGLLAAYRWWLWRNGPRKRRRQTLKALGHKARARLAAMARNMPGAGPVVRPVAQGAPS